MIKKANLRILSFHILYWVIAFTLYIFFVYLVTHRVNEFLPPDRQAFITRYFLWGLMAGFFTGLILGTVDLVFARWISNKRSLGFIIGLKSVLYIATLGVGIVVTTVIVSISDKTDWYDEIKSITAFNVPTYLFFFIASVLVNVINQINRKFGPGMVFPLLLGKYFHPKVEERVFMFLDLKSSTSYAERLGHIKYSELIQDCFSDLNRLIPEYHAEIYQYVGDEAVMTWRVDKDFEVRRCLDFFFSFQDVIDSKSDYYRKKYGLVPEFKAGMHCGDVTVAEVGDLKREIAFHGDVINTASRIQQVCNQYNQSLLVSENFEKRLSMSSGYKKEVIGDVPLRGKVKNVKIIGIEKT